MAPVTEIPVEGPSDIITCEEIHERLGRHGTVIEFEHGVNSAGKRLWATAFATPQPPHGSWNQE
jgi:hypothetical protein